MFNKDIMKVISTCVIIVTIIVIAVSFKDKLIRNEDSNNESYTVGEIEYIPDEDYYTNNESITSGCNTNDYKDIEIVNIDIDSMENISYILAERFCIGLQVYCNDNDIKELFVPIRVYAGPNNNITKLDVESNNYKLTLTYDISTDYVEVTQTEETR